MRSLGQVCVGFRGQRDHPQKAVVRAVTACRSFYIPRTAVWLRTNATPYRSPTLPCRHQALRGLGAAKERSRQTKARRGRTSNRVASSEGARPSRPHDVPRRARGLGGVTSGACTTALCNCRYAAGGRRCRRPSQNAGDRPDERRGAVLLAVWLTGRFTVPIEARVDGPDRSRR
jgi:hypothetical protein